MSNPNVPPRAFVALLFAVALAAGGPGAARAEDADQPEAGATGTASTDDKASAEGFAPEEREEPAATAADQARGRALCARLDDLMAKGLSYAERDKTAQTRAALHCPPTLRATQAAEGSPTGK